MIGGFGIMLLRKLVVTVLLLLGAIASPAVIAQTAGEPRIALVVGNAAYGANFGALANPVNDARMVAAALQAAGFEVEVVTDADQRKLNQAISRFGQRLNGAGRKATGLFYYAGHGVQSRGDNYLIPVNTAMTSEADLDLDAVNANAVLSQMQDAGVSTSIVILDACRNMPLTRSFRSGTRGLARMDAPNGSYIAYSTAPGQTAVDGSDGNSPFATAFAREILQADQPIDATFTKIRRAVSEATGQAQTPWTSSSLLDNFVFRLAGAQQAQPPAAILPPTAAVVARPPYVERPNFVDRLGEDISQDSGGDPALAGYAYGFRLWEAKRYYEAQVQLKAVSEKYGNGSVASRSLNLLGRAYLDDGKSALASEAFYRNYQKYPKGDRAADSLAYLGEALLRLQKPADACKVYEELQSVYGQGMRASIRSMMDSGRIRANCR